MPTMLGRMVGSTASGSWENYYVADEHAHNTNLFLNTSLKKGRGVKVIPVTENHNYAERDCGSMVCQQGTAHTGCT
jgi:hypothetical protein